MTLMKWCNKGALIWMNIQELQNLVSTQRTPEINSNQANLCFMALYATKS